MGRALALVCLPLIAAMSGAATPPDAKTGPTPPVALERLARSPAVFIENQGQWVDDTVRFALSRRGVNVGVTDDGLRFQVFPQAPEESASAAAPPAMAGTLAPQTAPSPAVRAPSPPLGERAGVRGIGHGLDRNSVAADAPLQITELAVRFVGARRVTPVGEAAAQAVFHYHEGEAAQWRENVPSWDAVVYRGLYDGIDLRVKGRSATGGSGIKYEFVVAPGADWRQVQMRYDGSERLTLRADGALEISLGGPERARQRLGVRQPAAAFAARGQTKAPEDWRSPKPGGVSPVPLGGPPSGAGEPPALPAVEAWPALVDAAPEIYQEVNGQRVPVAGRFVLLDDHTHGFEITGPYDRTQPLVIDPELEWSTYLGGSGSDYGSGIAVDSGGNVLVVGSTLSSGWVNGGGDATYDGDRDIFVAKLNPSGTHLWSTYLGGSDNDWGAGIAVDSTGNVFVTGGTSSDGWVAGGFDTSFNGVEEAFVAKLSPEGVLLWSTYFGGDNGGWGDGIAVDTAGNVLITGKTWDGGWASGGFDTDLNVGPFGSGFLVKLSPSGAHLWSTYLGSEGENPEAIDECGIGVAVDSAGNALVTGQISQSGWVSGGYDTSYNGNVDAFVAKLSPSGAHLWSTYLGGSNGETGWGIAVDSANNVLVTGGTTSSAWVSSGFDTSHDGGSLNGDDAFVAKLSPSGAHLWSTYLGGGGDDRGTAIAVDSAGNVLVAGTTQSSGWVSGGFDASYNGGGDAFVAKIRDGQAPPPATIQGTVVASPTSAVADGQSAVAVTVTVQDGSGQPLAGKTVKVSALGTTVGVSIAQPAAPTDANGRATATLTSLTAGTVLIAATDATDGIALSQQAQQPRVTFTANLVPPNDDLRQAIGSLFDNTVAGMKANAVIGSDAGQQGDAFRANLFADAAGIVLDALVGVVNLASGVSHSAKFAGLLAEPGLAETGAGPLITDPAKLAYIFDTELIHGELTSRVLESVFRSVLATALKKGATKLGVEGIKDGLRQIAAQDDGLSQIAENARQSVDLFEQSLQQRKEPLLSNGIPPLSTAQQTAWATDLDLRGQTWKALVLVLSQQDHFLQQFTAARATSSADAIEWFLQKLLVQATATVLFDGPGVLVTGGLFLVLDERQDLLNWSGDLTGYQMAFSTLGGVVQRNNELYLNAASAYTELAQARLARPVTGEVGQMSDVEEGHAWKLLGLVPKFSVANAYSQVNVRNTSSGDATFEVFVLWGYASSAFNVSIPDLAQVSIGVARIPAQAEAPISVLYKHGSHGAEPDAATTMTVFVLGNNESGTFYVGQFSHDWNPTQKEAVGEAYVGSGLHSSVVPMDDSGPTNALPAMENPVNVYVTQDAESQTYRGRIFVVNPFGQSYYAIVTQALPTGATVLATDGALSNSTIVWTNSIAAGGLAKDSFTFRLPLNPGAATNLVPALVTFTDTVGTSEPLASDEAGFTGLFPVQVTGSVPLGTPGTNATMRVTVTNLTAFAQSGTLTLTLTNATLAFGTNLAQPFIVTTASATNLNYSLPGDVPAGQYAVTGLLSMNGGSGQVLSGVYTMPQWPFSLSLGTAPVWSTNGLSLALAGPVGSNYLIQASTDLANWTPVRYFAITNSPFYFNDATATNSGARFYRAVIP